MTGAGGAGTSAPVRAGVPRPGARVPPQRGSCAGDFDAAPTTAAPHGRPEGAPQQTQGKINNSCSTLLI